MSVYDQQLKEAAARLLDSKDFLTCVDTYVEELKSAVFDAPDDAEALKARNDYNAIREFIEYLRMVRVKPQERD